ncbi:MAG: hypothetical protein ACE5MK_04060 [Acidobacteriota bacterium]
MLTKRELQQLDRRLKDLICSECIVAGTCTSPLGECPISLHLPRLVEVVRSVQSDRMEPYVQKVREDVCTLCRSALFPRGECDFREEGHCVLDAYLLPIVTTIDDFLGEKNAAER